MALELIPLAVVLVGLLYAYFGLVVHFVSLFLFGFAVGAVGGFLGGAQSTGSAAAALVVAVVVGFVAGFAAILFHGVAVLGLGYAFGHALGLVFGFDGNVSVLLGLVGAVLAWQLNVALIVVSTAGFGSLLVTAGRTALAVVRDPLGIQPDLLAGELSLTLVGVFVTGVAVQTWLYLSGTVMEKADEGEDTTVGEEISRIRRRSGRRVLRTGVVLALVLLGGRLGLAVVDAPAGAALGLAVAVPAWLYLSPGSDGEAPEVGRTTR